MEKCFCILRPWPHPPPRLVCNRIGGVFQNWCSCSRNATTNDHENYDAAVLLAANPLARIPLCLPRLQPGSRFATGSQDMSAFLTQQGNAESESLPSVLPSWLGGAADSQPAPCIPDDDLELEWIHGYSAQVGAWLERCPYPHSYQMHARVALDWGCRRCRVIGAKPGVSG